MNEILYHYDRPEPATWFYLSSLLMIGLFFKFGRFWSVRNLDLILLILLAPGLLFIHYGKQLESEQVAATSAVAKTNPNGVESAVIAEPDKLSTDGEAAEGGSTLSTGMKAQRFGFLWLFCTIH